MDITKIKKETLGDQVTESLKELIISGKWDVGEKLPSENDLAADFGVSRLTIRLAFQRLVSLGILETKVGEGTFVKEFNFEWYLNEVSNVIIKPGMLDDVQDFRRLIEIESGRLAIKSASKIQLSELKIAALSFDNFVYNTQKDLESNLREYVQMDYHFHYKLCEMSNNSLILFSFITAKEPIIRYMTEILRSRWEKYFNKDYIDKSTIIKFPSKAHYDIYSSINNKDLKEFQMIYLKMVDYKDTNYLVDIKE